MSKLVKYRAAAFKAWDNVKIVEDALAKATREKDFIRLQKRLNKIKKIVEKWRNKALELDGLPNAESKLPPAQEIEMEEYMGPLWTPKEAQQVGNEFE